jgi:NMD protein affecting ribosome stability and mRNA decay
VPKRPAVPETNYDPLYEELAKALVALRKRVTVLEMRLAVNPNQRNCPHCGRLVPRRGAATCGVCGGKLNPPTTE